MDNLLENHLPLREKIYKVIRKAILDRELKPGNRVTELELAKKYGISRTPIREAFRRLESEGFLTILPRKGAVVTEIKEQTVIEFYQIKGALEVLAGLLASETMTEEDIKELEKLNDELKKVADSEVEVDTEEFNKIHNKFHETFIQKSNNKLLIDLLQLLVKRYMRFRLMVEHTNFIEEVIKQHEEIIDAFYKKDKDLIEKSILKNSNLGIEFIKKYYLEEA